MLNVFDKQDASQSSMEGRIFDGTVIDNNDPEKKGRVKVRSSDQHTNIKDVDIPWVRLGGNLTYGLTSSVGTISIPVLGSRITYTLMGEDQYHPIAIGQPITDKSTVKEITDRNYPHTRGGVDRSGNIWLFDSKEDVFQFTHVTGTSITIDGKGHVYIGVADNKVGPDAKEYVPQGITINVIGNTTVVSSGDTSIHTQGSFSAVAGGSMTLHAGGEVNIAGSNVRINDNGPSSPKTPDTPVARERPVESVDKDNITM